MMLSEDAVLGVSRSVSGRFWRNRLLDSRASTALAQAMNMPEIVARVLAARGVTADSYSDFVKPSLRTLMPDPSRLTDMDIAVDRLADALENSETIAVFGDYDVDGATSSALLKRYLEHVDGRVRVYIPDRLKEGYGPNEHALKKLESEGARVVVTVDCGTTAFAALEYASAANMDVIVVDHHDAEARRPPCLALVNPKRFDDRSDCGQLAAVGVVFLLVVGLNRALRSRGWFSVREEPDLRQWLDLVALGTICDVVPLTGVNRALVNHGLRVLMRRGNVGLAALADSAGVREPPGTYHASYVLGPRVNAGGRVGEADLGARLLSTDDRAEAVALATRLDALNAERRSLEKEVERAAMSQLEERVGDATPLVVAAGEGWHPGVIGIVASRLMERYRRPALVIALEGDIGKGSARSIAGVDFGAAVIAARQAGLLIAGGGHAMAAGLTVAADKLAALTEFLTLRLEAQVAGSDSMAISVDGALTVAAANGELVDTLRQVGPFGAGNPEPRFAISATRVAHASVVGERHIRCVLTDSTGARLNGIAFRSVDSCVGQTLMGAAGRALHVLGYLRFNEWRGHQQVQLTVVDLAVA